MNTDVIIILIFLLFIISLYIIYIGLNIYYSDKPNNSVYYRKVKYDHNKSNNIKKYQCDKCIGLSNNKCKKCLNCKLCIYSNSKKMHCEGPNNKCIKHLKHIKKKKCSICYGNTRNQCAKCKNCVYCYWSIGNKYGTCVSGNKITGPNVKDLQCHWNRRL